MIYVRARPTDYTLRIAEPDATWPQRYGELEAEVRAALGDRVLDIQHIGSTAVPQLPAKPVIDIDLSVADPANEAAYIPELEVLGYVHWLTDLDWHQHRLLKRLDEPRVHLHVFGADCPEAVRHRMFRDWLIAHPEDRDRYASPSAALPWRWRRPEMTTVHWVSACGTTRSRHPSYTTSTNGCSGQLAFSNERS